MGGMESPLLRFWLGDDARVKADRAKLKSVRKADLCKP